MDTHGELSTLLFWRQFFSLFWVGKVVGKKKELGGYCL